MKMLRLVSRLKHTVQAVPYINIVLRHVLFLKKVLFEKENFRGSSNSGKVWLQAVVSWLFTEP